MFAQLLDEVALRHVPRESRAVIWASTSTSAVNHVRESAGMSYSSATDGEPLSVPTAFWPCASHPASNLERLPQVVVVGQGTELRIAVVLSVWGWKRARAGACKRGNTTYTVLSSASREPNAVSHVRVAFVQTNYVKGGPMLLRLHRSTVMEVRPPVPVSVSLIEI